VAEKTSSTPPQTHTNAHLHKRTQYTTRISLRGLLLMTMCFLIPLSLSRPSHLKKYPHLLSPPTGVAAIIASVLLLSLLLFCFLIG